MIILDGTYGEGGGQIVRNALALSMLTGQPFSITGIRASREQPGLKAQHLTAIRALESISDASAAGATPGSLQLTFFPGKVNPGHYYFDIGTAGSIGLLLQALLLPLLFAEGRSRLILRGGTCGRGQAPVYFIEKVFLPYLKRMGTTELEVRRHGFYPKGGGEVALRISPELPHWSHCAQLPPYALDRRPPLKSIEGISFAGEALRRARVAERQAQAAGDALSHQKFPVLPFHSNYLASRNPGSGIVLWATFEGDAANPGPLILGADALGKRGKPAEEVGREAADNLILALSFPAPVDLHLADQLIPFLALVPGSAMTVPYLTDHLRSNIYVTESFLPVRFTIAGNLIQVEEKKKGKS